MSESRIIRPYSGFIIPTRRFVDVGMPKTGVTMKGRYQLRVLDAYGIEKRRTPWFDNIILDSGLNRWGTGTIILGAAIGTGTATPASTDTGLQTETTYTTTTGTGAGIAAGIAPNYNNTRTFVYRTALGALNGNYSEVGVGWASGSMFSRALILDGGGSPLPITVTSSEQLDIVYQLSVYPPIVDTGPTTITISGVNYDVTGRALQVTATTGQVGTWSVGQGVVSIGGVYGSFTHYYSGNIGSITSGPSGTMAGYTSSTSDSYVGNSLQRTGYHTVGLTDGNVSGGIKSCRVGWTSWGFQYEFNNVIPKDGTKTLVLNFSSSWARR